MQDQNDEKISLGLAHEVEIMARKAGWRMSDFTLLSQDINLCKRILPVIRGLAEVQNIIHVVDTDLPPLLPGKDWGVEKHVGCGKRIIDPAKLILHLEPEQKADGEIKGDVLSERLTGRPDALGIHERDYLYDHPELIPETWKQVAAVYGWNTILRDPGGHLCVPCLDWDGDGWYRNYYWLDDQWGAEDPAGLLAS